MDHTNSPLPVNRTMPACSIIPVLGYADVPQAIEWLTNVFGFKERWRAGDHRAQMSFGDGAIALSKQAAINDTGQGSSGASLVVPGHSMMVRVPDVFSHYEHVRQRGAQVLQPPIDFPYGERQYNVLDIGGHVWVFSQSIADLAPETWGGIPA